MSMRILQFNDFSDYQDIILEKNVPNKPGLWQSCKATAKKKYDVWPSAYACGFAAKLYKKKGGTWRKAKKRASSEKR
jgi:hypothetical protein